jgi:serine/threonine protein kinase
VLVFDDETGKVTAKLSDFGFAESCLNTDDGTIRCFRSYKGTRRGYMAPEIHTVFEEGSNGYDGRPADVFALGVLLFSMLFRKLPFEFATK